MFGGFAHLEILGPRKRLDRWLEALQDQGCCHVADALVDLEGEVGLGRPVPDPDEERSTRLRADAAFALRAIARLLPPRGKPLLGEGMSDVPAGAHARPTWQIGPGGVDEGEVQRLRDEAVRRADAIREALEALRETEDAVDHIDAITTALGLLEESGKTRIEGSALVLPAGTRGVRGILRRLRRMGIEPRRGDARRGTVVLLGRADGNPALAPSDPIQLERGVQSLAETLGARVQALPDAGTERPVAEALREHRAARDQALAAESQAQSALHAAVAENGAEARWLLDSIEDAEAREACWARLGAAEHIVAARVFVRTEDRPALLEALKRDLGDRLHVRTLAPSDDAPSLPEELAPTPFAALRDLLPARFGLGAATRFLALATPFAAALAGPDVVLGCVLVIVGLLLALGARKHSPRRDMAALAIGAGALCLVFGLLAGVALGRAGSWGWWPAAGRALMAGGGSGATVFSSLLFSLGFVAAGVALYGIPLALHAWRRDYIAMARRRAVLVLEMGTLACLGFATGAGPYAPITWAIAVLALVGLAFLMLGPAGFVRRYLVDLVGGLRLVAVAGAALLVCDLALVWIGAGSSYVLLAPLLLCIGAFGLVLDASQMAMGVPYDLPLGGQRYLKSFEPLARTGATGDAA